MKSWYQFRVEEMDSTADPIDCILSSGISGRLRRLLLKRLFFGGLRWQYAMGYSEWRGVYGSAQ